MENVISIVNTRENPLEFDISIQGITDKETSVKFVIETNPVHFGFICKEGDAGKWIVTIPPLPHIERVSYPFHIEIVVDGYYFEPYSGTLTVTAEPEVTASDVHKTRPVIAPVVKSVTVQEEKDDISDDEFKTLADKIIAKHKKSPIEEKVEVKKPTRKKADPAKEKAIKEAIAQLKNAPIEESSEKKADGMELDDGKIEDDTEVWKEKTKDKEVKLPRKSNLTAAIKQLEEGPELSDQAKKVRDIVGMTKH